MRQSRWAFVVAGALCVCVFLLAPLAGASNSSIYADPSDDAASAAPDLTAVQVSNDDLGNVVFRISIPNRAELGDTDLIALLIDADAKAGTGCARGVFGAEYALDVLAGRYMFGRCVHGSWDFTKRPASFGGSFSGSTLTLKANRRDLGATTHFKFRVGAGATTNGDAAFDFAPDTGIAPWSYQVVAPREAVTRAAAVAKKRLCKPRKRRCVRRR